MIQAFKNHCYSRIYQELPRFFPRRNATLDKGKLLLMRPAAVAEININGTNIHSTFIIPVVKDQNKIFFLLEIEKEER